MKTVVSETSKVVILTGASSGIGEAIARHLSRKGHHLFIGARRIEKLTALATELRATGGIAAYAASKGALAQLTRTLALEAITHGIRVNAVGSGDAVTNITNTIQPDGQAYLAEHGRKAPVGRAAHPDEIAEVAAFLASDRASYIVGAVVMADGGMSVAIQ